MEKIRVKPLGDGWAVETPSTDNPMVFRSGRAAEDAGKRLARRLARAGSTTELELRLRSGVCAGRFLCVPPVDEDDDVLLLGLPGLPPGGGAAFWQGHSGNP
ncbi:hypothetical protein GCM10009116_15810 [Brevundimonas basaltis]|uniref:DUF2188 domain-containing protein n=1 Tax=Brevundimonas basaltis TaxID=472166 RepID=A0A7W8HY67_9CAUL|nr:hypothetical protein [Brevundimonas basaltis]MBB5291107.1 hypothetical protein [Brevundimonas basaltis]